MIVDKRFNYDSFSKDDDNCLGCVSLRYYDEVDPNRSHPLCINFWVECNNEKFLGGASREGVCDLFKRHENDRLKGEIDKERAKDNAEKERANLINIFDVLKIIESERPENIDDTKGNLLIERLKADVSKLRG